MMNTLGDKAIRQRFEEDSRGNYFLNYLEVMQSEIGDWRKYRSYLLKHRSIIRKGLLNPDLKVREKYEWLRKYHNDCVGRLKRDMAHGGVGSLIV